MSDDRRLGDVSVIVPAAGRGARMGDDTPKQYLLLNGVPMLEHVLKKFQAMGPARLMVTVAPDDRMFRTLIAHEGCSVVQGGRTRAESVLNGLSALDLGPDDWVMVHDAARPCIAAEDILRLIYTVGNDDVGGILAVPVVETVKRTDDGKRVDATIARNGLWLAQTPQLFRYGLLIRGMRRASREGLEITDEASAVESLGLSPMLVEGRRDNIKVTTREDMALAEYYLREQSV